MANTFEGIRYFATNREMENLRQLRGDRVSLWSGGYFFIDMCRYVPHFMETVQERSLPEHCIVQNSDDVVFREFLVHPKVGAVAICVHGFNVALHESYFWFRTLTDTLRILAEMVGGIVVKPQAMEAAARRGHATATDLADYLVRKGVAFRDAHEIVARAVREADGAGVDSTISLYTNGVFARKLSVTSKYSV